MAVFGFFLVMVAVCFPLSDGTPTTTNSIYIDEPLHSIAKENKTKQSMEIKHKANLNSTYIEDSHQSLTKVKGTKLAMDLKHKVNVSSVELHINGLTGYMPINRKRNRKSIEMTSEFYSSSAPETRQDWERIVGGTKARNGSIPYQVSLRVYGVWHFCGASLVTPRVILTAAHCVERMKPQYFQAVVGTNQLRAGGKAYNIRKIVMHEDYDNDVITNDIAILFTEEEIDFGSKVDAVELNDEPVMKGEHLTLTGWGSTSYPGRLPNDLMQLELKSITYEECKEAHKNVNAVFETQICALTKAGEGACHGDSGGPLVREGRQIGIVSWGIPCARGKPDVYTKVEAYMRWIERTLYDDDEDHVRFIESHKKHKRLLQGRETNRH